MSPIISIQNISKLYRIGQKEPYYSLRDSIAHVFAPRKKKEEFWALKDVSFDVEKGDIVGIMGRNGAGKSTLLKILARITPPTRGTITMRGRVASLLEVGTGFNPELTGRENIYLNGAILGMTKREIRRKFDEIVAFSEVEKFLDTPVKRYSSGMYVRLAFSVAAHLEPEILIVDEVLAVGDAQFQKKCIGKMGDVAKDGRTILFVSHNMGAVKQLCNRAVLLKDGSSTGVCSVDEVLEKYMTSISSRNNVFSGGPLKNLTIRQEDESIILETEYQSDVELEVPCLGVTISDHYGTPIFGTNIFSNKPNKPIRASRAGRMRLTVDQPKLLDGTYSVSLWFGGGFRKDFFRQKDCVFFKVAGMAKTEKQLSPQSSGYIFPECEWDIEYL